MKQVLKVGKAEASVALSGESGKRTEFAAARDQLVPVPMANAAGLESSKVTESFQLSQRLLVLCD